MAYEVPGRKKGHMVAAADLSALQYRFVVINGDSEIAQSVTAGGRVDGVLQNKPELGRAAEVMVDGVSKVEAGDAVAAGALVTSDAGGRGIVAVTGNQIAGRAEQAAAAAGAIIAVDLAYRGVV